MALVADFHASLLSGPAPLVTSFSDDSTGGPTGWVWDFGDGHIGTIQSPTHIYTLPGVYTVTLTVSNAIDGSATKTVLDYITAEIPIPTAAFSVVPVIGYEPLTVSFTNESIGFPDSYSWNFGDSTTSTEENPIHTYEVVGSYDVTLTVSNVMGNDTTPPTTIEVLVTPDLVADFITVNSTGLIVQFLDRSKEALTYNWNFGDPGSGPQNTSTNQNPVHTYPGPGLYEVTLISTHGPFSDSICKSVLVTTDVSRYMEIWGTVRFSDGTPVSPDRVVTVNRTIATVGCDCGSSATDTTHVYKTVDDSGVTRFLVRARGHVLSVPDSGFEDGDPVYLFIGGRQITNPNGTPVSVPFFMTLPSNPSSSIELEVVFPLAFTTISPTPGTYYDHTTITLTNNIIPSTIYYTLDGSDPKVSPTRHQYTTSFVIEEGVTVVRYYTHDPLGIDEPTREAVYTVLEPQVTASPLPADYKDNLFVELVGTRAGDIYYRLDYTGAYTLYTGHIPIEAGPTGVKTTVIEAFLIDYHSEIGPVQEFIYKIDLINPVISVFTLSNGDLVTSSQIITVQIVAASHTNSVTGLLLSTFCDFRDASIRLYQPEVTFLLPPPDGIKTVYARVIDQMGHYSVGPVLCPTNSTYIHSATIELNTEIPTFTASPGPSIPISELSYTFTGTKSANSGIYLTINSGVEMLVVPFSLGTTWEYIVPLTAGINTLEFQAGTAVGNRSSIETRIVDARPISVGVTFATTITRSDGTWRIPFVYLEEKTGEEATEFLDPPKKQHHNIKKRQHDFRIRVTASSGPDPIVTYPTQDMVLTQNLITVTGIAEPGSVITLQVERRGKVPA